VPTPCDVLVLAAFSGELAPLAPLLGDGMDGRVGARRVVARVAGIGLPAAAAAAAIQIRTLWPSAVVAIGTCGAYPGSGLAIGDVVVARRLHLVDPCALRGESEYPDPMPVASESDGTMTGSIRRAVAIPLADVATTLAITVDDALAAAVARRTGAAVEHLEAYGIAVACALSGVPFGAVLGVANGVGSRARSEWRLHHRDVEHAVASVLSRWLSVAEG
jgi:futalosine hydrolase